METDENYALIKKMRIMKNSYEKDKAVLKQRIELLENSLKDSKKKEKQLRDKYYKILDFIDVWKTDFNWLEYIQKLFNSNNYDLKEYDKQKEIFFNKIKELYGNNEMKNFKEKFKNLEEISTRFKTNCNSLNNSQIKINETIDYEIEKSTKYNNSIINSGNKNINKNIIEFDTIEINEINFQNENENYNAKNIISSNDFDDLNFFSKKSNINEINEINKFGDFKKIKNIGINSELNNKNNNFKKNKDFNSELNKKINISEINKINDKFSKNNIIEKNNNDNNQFTKYNKKYSFLKEKPLNSLNKMKKNKYFTPNCFKLKKKKSDLNIRIENDPSNYKTNITIESNNNCNINFSSNNRKKDNFLSKLKFKNNKKEQHINNFQNVLKNKLNFIEKNLK